MAKDGDSSEKTYQPTRRRRRQARKDGQVAKSRELSAGAGLVGWLAAALIAAPAIHHATGSLLLSALGAGQRPFAEAAPALGAAAAHVFATSALALAAPAALAASAALFLQVGPLFTGATLKFDLSRLDPVRGLGAAFKLDNLVELLRTAAAATLLTALLLATLKALVPNLAGLSQAGPEAMAATLLHGLEDLLAVAAAVAVAVGFLDLLYQRFSLNRRLKMTREEVKQDRRVTDGDPKTKSRRRDLYREWIGHNAEAATREATVVVTNPTRLAVALAYDPARHLAPVVAAKGQGPIAAQIRAAAREAGIPLIENVPLARALHARAEVDDAVPENLFAAVAEVIVWANRLRGSLEQTAGNAVDPPEAGPQEPSP